MKPRLSQAAIDQFRGIATNDGEALAALSVIEGANELLQRLETFKARSPEDVRLITLKVYDLIEFAVTLRAPLVASELEAALARATGGGGH